MAAPTPTTEPSQLIAGDTAKWLKTLADYSAADGWTLTYTLVNASTKITFDAMASGSDFMVSVPATTTTGWSAGDYSWRSQVSRDGEVYTVARGSVTVQPAFGAAVDARSFARVALANIESYLKDANNLAAARYQIAGRELHKIPRGELLKERDKWKAEVAREDAATNLAAGLPDRRRVMVRFGP